MLKDRKKLLTLILFSEDNIIKVFYIISGVALSLAGILFVFVFDVHKNERIEEILSSRSLKVQFLEKRAKISEKCAKPAEILLQQSEAFARYLKTNKKANKTVVKHKAKEIPPRKPRISPKFKLVATSYYEANPEISQALIDEPVKGRHWIKQSSLVGSFFIEQISDGLIVVKNDKDTFELLLKQESEMSPTTGVSFASKVAVDRRSLLLCK